MFLKKSSILLIFFLFLNNFSFSEELISKHKIEHTKYRYYQNYDVSTGNDNIINSLNNLKKNKEVSIGFNYQVTDKSKSSYIKFNNQNETSIFLLKDQNNITNRFNNDKYSKIDEIKRSTFLEEVFIKIPQLRNLSEKIWIYKSLDNLILKIYDKKLLHSNSISFFTDSNLDLSKYFISANAFNKNNEIYEWSMKNMIQKNNVNFYNEKYEKQTYNKSTLSNDGKLYKFNDTSREQLSHIIIFFDKNLSSYLDDLYYAKFENEIFYEPLILEDNYALFNFISKLKKIDEIQCVNCELKSLFIFRNQVEKIIPYFHFDHINKLKSFLSNNNLYLNSIFKNKQNLEYFNDALLKLLKFNPNDIKSFKQSNLIEYFNNENLKEFSLLNKIKLEDFYIINKDEKIVNLNKFLSNICNDKNLFIPISNHFVKTSTLVKLDIDGNFLNCHYNATKSIEFLYINKKQKYLNDDIFLKFNKDIKIQINDNNKTSKSKSLINYYIFIFDIFMFFIFIIIFKYYLNFTKYIYLLFFLSFVFLIFINSNLFIFFIYKIGLYIIFSYLLFFIFFDYFFKNKKKLN